ncbi:uncharacterized protein TrAtP1_005318 [Trichoderma atroviride]|uniref:uncharacterized protein n=1 Tax=Hypocrea atroviridis TaxID=63577 RepID=UPI00332480B7|nr:hypothetical protein TrAtP1_005318 [Trichoderma atroviride]
MIRLLVMDMPAGDQQETSRRPAGDQQDANACVPCHRWHLQVPQSREQWKCYSTCIKEQRLHIRPHVSACNALHDGAGPPESLAMPYEQ